MEFKGGGVERVVDDECNNDLCNVLSCVVFEGGSFGGFEYGLRNGVILGGFRESIEVKIELLLMGIMNFELEFVNFVFLVFDGGFFFWVLVFCMYGFCLLKLLDFYFISIIVVIDLFFGVCYGSFFEVERDR